MSFSAKVEYGLYEVTSSPDGNWAKRGDRYVLAMKLAEQVMRSAKVEEFERLGFVAAGDLADVVCAHPLRDKGYDFAVPLLAGDHVTDEDGTGFVHTAPGHGREDFDVWMENAPKLQQRGIDTTIPFTVDGDGRFTKDAPGFEGKRVIDDKGNKGDANDAVIKALVEANALIARGRLKHQYPHSWRSKKPVIFRNTPQWFIAMDKPLGSPDRAASVPSPLWGRDREGGIAERLPSWLPPPLTPPRKGEGNPRAVCAATRPCGKWPCKPSPRPSSCRPPARTACAA